MKRRRGAVSVRAGAGWSAEPVSAGRLARIRERAWVFACLALAVLAWASVLPVQAQGVRLGSEGIVAAPGGLPVGPAEPLGRYARLLDEIPGQPLTIEQARARLAAGDFVASTAEVPNLGNSAPPRWMHLDIANTADTALDYRIYVAEGWTDRLDVWLFGPGGEPRHWQAGDDRSPARYLRIGLGYAFDTHLPPGKSELFVRVDSIDSAALALRLVRLGDTGAIEGEAQHWLGLIDGFLLALVATYGLLWLALRESNLLRYVAYVGCYLGMHLAYSGVGAHALWPDSPGVARYAILVGMMLFSSSGLWFARGFLGLAQFAPRVDRVVAWVVRIALAAMAALIVAGWQAAAVELAFDYIRLFTFAMVGLGLLGVLHRREQSPVFLVASVLSMAGALVTTLAVMGRLPFNAFTFRAVEVGVAVEAVVWALALGLRLRRQQADRAHAIELARHDPLTGLYNRRGFMEHALPVHSTSSRRSRPMAVVMIDIDHFKRINDLHGHDAGDRTLVAVADHLRNLSRQGDVVARWGGEEFVMLLPETPGDRAQALAERLREVFATTQVALGGSRSTVFTASFGVAARETAMSLEDMLRAADAALYAAKNSGRDCVVVSGAGLASPAPAATG